jgi:Winged helix-turn-helix DNA-binding
MYGSMTDLDVLLVEQPLATVREIAAATGVARSTVADHRRKLVASGLLPQLSRREMAVQRNRARIAAKPDAVMPPRRKRSTIGTWTVTLWRSRAVMVDGKLREVPGHRVRIGSGEAKFPLGPAGPLTAEDRRRAAETAAQLAGRIFDEHQVPRSGWRSADRI